VLAATFVAFPLLGLAARGRVPWVLTPDLYAGVLFLCLVPSTMQSSIAFTSIARGNVPAAIVSASLSNILGVALTPLLVVYTAFSMSMAEHVWSTVSPWRVVAVAGVCAALLAVMLAVTVGMSRLARLDPADAVVVLFCGSKKSLASALPMALVFSGAGAVGLIMLPLIIFHQIQLFVCAVIASRMSRTVPAS
jgi:sodium/bile acid cotransporter 7